MRPLVSSIAAISTLAFVGFATSALADQAPAPAPQPKAPQTTATTKTAATPAPKPVLICRSQVSTGSLLPERECHTPDQWADIRRHGNDQLGNIAARPAGLGQ